MKLEKQRKKIRDITKPTKHRVETFEEYFQECIKNKLKTSRYSYISKKSS